MTLPLLRIVGFLLLVGVCWAANDPRPVVGPGATKEEVVAAYGWPNGTSQSGNKEILTYAQGEVVLENGRVERVNFSPSVPWQTPRPKPPPATPSTRKVPERPVDYWLADFGVATAEAQRRHARILALFTGSDWSPGSRQFHDEVEYHPDFVNAFAGDFVFVKLDYPRGSPVPAKISEENSRLRDRFQVTTYPTLLVLSASGELMARTDLTKVAGATYRENVIAAVREARDATGGTSMPAPVVPEAAVAAPAPEAAAEPVATPTNSSGTALDSATAPVVHNAGVLVALGLIAGAVAAGLVIWRMMRAPQAPAQERVDEMKQRIDMVAGGLPLPSEMAEWSKAKLTAITAALAVYDDYTPQERSPGGDVDIELRKRGDARPRVLVQCVPGSHGVVHAKGLRELFASLAAEGVEFGWCVSPAGFAKDAKDYAAAHKIVLVGSSELHNLMREVPPVSLPSLLAKE